jgi:hypothetical protein
MTSYLVQDLRGRALRLSDPAFAVNPVSLAEARQMVAHVQVGGW